ncbi:MAG: hypothetical protein NTY38_14590 [Acidobacteria bacterium]|nr:hypothetical protein [Acidobacteriota bacterium]
MPRAIRPQTEPAGQSPVLRSTRAEAGKTVISFSRVAGVRYRFSVAAENERGATAFSAELPATPSLKPNWEDLAEAFRSSNPTRSCCPFLLVFGDEPADGLRPSLDTIHAVGFEGVTLHPYEYRAFLEPEMWRQWRVVLQHAKHLGLTVWQQDDQNYPSGDFDYDTIPCTVFAARLLEFHRSGDIVISLGPAMTVSTADGTGAGEVERGEHGQLHLRHFSAASFAYSLEPLGQQPNARLAIEGMTQILHAKLNGTPLGTRLAHPFRFDLSAALRTGSNALELQHTERHTFRSRLGSVHVLPYRLITINTHKSNPR